MAEAYDLHTSQCACNTPLSMHMILDHNNIKHKSDRRA